MKIVLVNQCFQPDVVSAGQHLTDLAVELAARGHDATVISSRRGYDDPSLRFPNRETWNGISIRRVPVLALGKKSLLRRGLSFLSFYASCLFQLLALPPQDLTVMMTSPPLIAFAGRIATWIKGGQLAVWIMDLNPDEAIAAGVLKPTSVAAGLLETMLRCTLNSAGRIIVLDRFMRARLLEKGVAAEKITVIPPWSHDEAQSFNEAGRATFRSRHGLANKFVVMYSGNHSPCHPLDTVLRAAAQMAGDDHIRFCFIGGGSEFVRVQRFAEQASLGNVLCLPYQPLAEISGSLSAADLHLIVMGDAYVGIKHPCKVYNIVSLGIPFVFIGPADSHVSDLIAANGLQDGGSVVGHGDVDGLVAHITRAAQQGCGRHVDRRAVTEHFSESVLVPWMADVLEARAGAVASATRASAAWGS